MKLLGLSQKNGVVLSSTDKDRLLSSLRSLLEANFEERRRGTYGTPFAHGQGYADGYMRCLLEAGLVSSAELLTIVQEARRHHGGPATAELGTLDESSAILVA